jgi:hypothetical protein
MGELRQAGVVQQVSRQQELELLADIRAGVRAARLGFGGVERADRFFELRAEVSEGLEQGLEGGDEAGLAERE